MRIAIGLEYAGAGFTGWQSQPDGRAVQDALERALAAIADHPVRTHAAGRTDAGVHALSQIAHFDTSVERPLSAWVRGANAHLPDAVAVLWSAAVDDTFHARYAARARHYSYVLQNRPSRPGVGAGRVGWYHHPLDVAAMVEAAGALTGTHDFSAFRAAQCQARTPVRTLSPVTITTAADLIRLDFSADAFLHHMIRNIVGALVAVGSGRQKPEWIGELIASRERARGAPTFAAAGLYFTGADYDPRFGLPPTRRELAMAPLVSGGRDEH